jgi:hypothetical protein
VTIREYDTTLEISMSAGHAPAQVFAIAESTQRVSFTLTYPRIAS